MSAGNNQSAFTFPFVLTCFSIMACIWGARLHFNDVAKTIGENQQIINNNQKLILSQLMLNADREVLDSLSAVDKASLSDEDKARYDSTLDLVIRRTVRRKKRLDTVRMESTHALDRIEVWDKKSD